MVFVGLWASGGWLRIWVLEAEDVAVVGVAWPLPFGPLRTLNEHFRL